MSVASFPHQGRIAAPVAEDYEREANAIDRSIQALPAPLHTRPDGRAAQIRIDLAYAAERFRKVGRMLAWVPAKNTDAATEPPAFPAIVGTSDRPK